MYFKTVTLTGWSVTIADTTGLTDGKGNPLAVTTAPNIIVTLANPTQTPQFPDQFVVAGTPATVVAGQTSSFTVTVQDHFGNVRNDGKFTSTIGFTSTDAQATFPVNPYTFKNTDKGTHLFQVVLKTVDPNGVGQTLTATQTDDPTAFGTSPVITVTPAAASKLVVSGYPDGKLPATATAGVAGTITATAQDPFGNVATGFVPSSVDVSSSVEGDLGTGFQVTDKTNGVFTVSGVTLKTAGVQALTLTAKATNSTVAGTQSNILVVPAAGTVLAISGLPTVLTAGVGQSFTVTVRDTFGNVVTGYMGTVGLTTQLTGTTTATAATFSNSPYTFTAADMGSHTFTVAPELAASQTLTVTDTKAPAVTATSAPFNVTPGAVAGFTVTGFPDAVTPGVVVAGTPGTVTVTAFDKFGNTATNFFGTVTFSLDKTRPDPAAVLPGLTTFTTADMGSHTFTNGVTLTKAGSQTITVANVADVTVTGSEAGHGHGGRRQHADRRRDADDGRRRVADRGHGDGVRQVRQPGRRVRRDAALHQHGREGVER